MSAPPAIVVTATSFSKNVTLRNELTHEFGPVKFNELGRTMTEAELLNALQDADAAIVGTESITDSLLAQLPTLKFISKYGVGLDNIDFEACHRRHIPVGWTGGVNKTAVAEMALAFMIALSRNLYQTSLQLKAGVWNKNGGHQFSGKTIGIIGVGFIGKELIRLLAPFNCRILVNDIVDQASYYSSVGAIATSKTDIFRDADFVTIHTPLTPETHHLVNQATLKTMKPSAFLINTARGGIVCLDDLKAALTHNMIAGAALDTYETEPITDLSLLQLPTLFCTPHIGANSTEAVLAMGRSAIHHIKEYFSCTHL